MVASAMFYGVEQRGFGDITASFLISLFATAPVLVAKQLFLMAKPHIIESERAEEERFNEETCSKFTGIDGAAALLPELLDGFATLNDKGTTTRRTTIAIDSERAETLRKTIESVKLKRTSIAIREINSALIAAQKHKSRAEKLALAENVRMVLYKSLYPLPANCKKWSWTVLILWSLGCAFVAILYGLQFDLLYDEESEWLGNCWQNFKRNVISRRLSEERMQDLQRQLRPNRPDNFPGASSSSLSFLISLGQSILLSLLLWQPLTIYLTTWLKLWMFTWNISMGMSPAKIGGLIQRCCGCAGGGQRTKDEKHLERQLSAHEVHGGSPSVVAHNDRPLDLLGFLGNDALLCTIRHFVCVARSKMTVSDD